MGRADADLSGDDAHARSCSSWVVCYSSAPTGTIHVEDAKANAHTETHALIDWAAKGNAHTSYSSPDSELKAICEMIVRSLGLIASFNLQAFPFVVKEEVGTDNSAALLALRSLARRSNLLEDVRRLRFVRRARRRRRRRRVAAETERRRRPEA